MSGAVAHAQAPAQAHVDLYAVDFDSERFEQAQARRGLDSSPACCPEPLVGGVPDGRHHSSSS